MAGAAVRVAGIAVRFEVDMVVEAKIAEVAVSATARFEVDIVEARVIEVAASATAREVDIVVEFAVAEVAVLAVVRFEVDIVEIAAVAACNQRSSQSHIGMRRQRSESGCDASGELLFRMSCHNR